MFRDEGPDLFIMALHNKHNAEDVRLKARPVGCARIYDTALACIEWVNIQFNATEAQRPQGFYPQITH